MNALGLATNAWWPPNDAAAEEFFRYAEEFDVEVCKDHYDAVVSHATARHLAGDAGHRIAEFLRETIAARTPASIIRLGDADGNVLFTELHKYPELTAYNLSKISQIYFGHKSVMVDHREFFAKVVVEAVQEADLVGAPEWGTIERSFSTALADLDVRGMCGMRGVYNYLATSFDLRRLGNAIWASTWFSRALLPFYFSILDGLPFLGFVTCYPQLEEGFRRRIDLGRTETVIVPMQASVAKVNRNICHYPDAYPSICERLQPPFDGAVYIVAAGILSKPYCTLIKQRGGIALDVGSVADVWMGSKTRPGMADSFIDKWKLF